MKKERVEGSLLVTDSIALKALCVLFLREEEKIRASFPSFFVEQTKHLTCAERAEGESRIAGERRILEEAALQKAYGIRVIRNIKEGGIFNALWDTCEALEAGCEVELERIPILQETVEICEMFDVNPYYADSSGSILIAAERGNELYWDLKRQGIASAVIGIFHSGRGRTILSETEPEHVRCLDRPQEDSLTHFLKSDIDGVL